MQWNNKKHNFQVPQDRETESHLVPLRFVFSMYKTSLMGTFCVFPVFVCKIVDTNTELLVSPFLRFPTLSLSTLTWEIRAKHSICPFYTSRLLPAFQGFFMKIMKICLKSRQFHFPQSTFKFSFHRFSLSISTREMAGLQCQRNYIRWCFRESISQI